jgi:enoyl reductase-like protein
VVAKDIADMTYEEVLVGMVRLMYVMHKGQWINLLLRNWTGNWLQHTVEQFASLNGGKLKPLVLQYFMSLDEPMPFIEKSLGMYKKGNIKMLPLFANIHNLILHPKFPKSRVLIL